MELGRALLMGWMGFISCSSGIAIGGLAARFLKPVINKSIVVIFPLCAGMIFGLIFLDIVPESINLGGLFPIIGGAISSLFFYRYLHQLTGHIIIITNHPQKDILLQTTTILALSIALHNFPTGIVFGVNHESELGSAVIITLFMHNLPEGMAVSIPLFAAGYGLFSILILSTIVSIPVGIGAFIGSLTGVGVSLFTSIITGFTIGMILLITVSEILAPAFNKTNYLQYLIVLSIGFLSIYLYHQLL